jgi:hypothetical protein
MQRNRFANSGHSYPFSFKHFTRVRRRQIHKSALRKWFGSYRKAKAFKKSHLGYLS